MANRLIAELQKTTRIYYAELRPYLGSVLSCILFNQLEYWFSRYPKGFYKFQQAQQGNEETGKKKHPLYKNGDSWCEELGFSIKEFRNAFEAIGHTHQSITAFKNANGSEFIRPDGTIAYYCAVIDRQNHLTYYYRNNFAVDCLIDDLIEELKKEKESEQEDQPQMPKGNLPEMPKGDFQRCQKGTSRDAQMEHRYTDNTSESNNKDQYIDHSQANDRPHDQLPLFSISDFENKSAIEQDKMRQANLLHYLNASNPERSDLPRAACGKVENSAGKNKARGDHAPEAFDEFWQQFPIKKGKLAAKTAWNRLKANSELVSAIMHDIANRKQNDRQWVEGFCTHAATYLNGRRWEDEIEPLTIKKSGVQSIQSGKISEEEQMAYLRSYLND